MVTGWGLGGGYIPSDSEAFSSILYLRNMGGVGQMIRSLHFYLSSSLIISGFIFLISFYILGYEGDTVDTIKETLNYSRKINSFVSRFSISTPFPGTGFYTQLNDQNRILTKNFELFTLNNLVYQHPNLSSKQAKELLEEAFRKYYFRPIYFLRLLKWKIREFWL